MYFKMEGSILPKLAFDVLKNAEKVYAQTGTFSKCVLESLYSVFGENFVLATELLENCRVIEYEAENGLRKLFKVISSREQYPIYENINFCHCETFQLHVLESKNVLTCKHVLVVKLAKITGQLFKEKVSNSHFVDFLNEEMCFVKENPD